MERQPITLRQADRALREKGLRGWVEVDFRQGHIYVKPYRWIPTEPYRQIDHIIQRLGGYWNPQEKLWFMSGDRSEILPLDQFLRNGGFKYRVLHDDGSGVTQLSLRYFRRNAAKLGRILEVNISRHRLFSMEVQGTEGVVLLSGCNCGYGGTGPHGSIEILEALGISRKEAEAEVFNSEHMTFNFRDKWIHINA